MKNDYVNPFSDPSLKRYRIKLDDKTEVVVNENQITKPRWVNHFGSLASVENFINNE